MGTVDDVFLLHGFISHILSHGKKIYCAFIDFTKAFDYVVRESVLNEQTLNVGMLHRVLKNYQICSNDDPGLTLTYFTARSNLDPYAFVWEKVK